MESSVGFSCQGKSLLSTKDINLLEFYAPIQGVYARPFSQKTHHNTAIEGNTLTQEQTTSILLDSLICSNVLEREYYEVRNYKKTMPLFYKSSQIKSFKIFMHLLWKIFLRMHEDAKLRAILKAHFDFERIHLFGDGNGRVGRIFIFYSYLQKKTSSILLCKKRKSFYISFLAEEGLDDLFTLAKQI